MSRLDSEVVRKVLENIEVASFLKNTISTCVNDCSILSQLVKEVKSLREANSRLTSELRELKNIINPDLNSNGPSTSSHVSHHETSNSSNSLTDSTIPVTFSSIISNSNTTSNTLPPANHSATKQDKNKPYKHSSHIGRSFGTGLANSVLVATPAFSWIYVGRLQKGTTEANVLDYLKVIWPDATFSCTDLKNKGNSCSFKIGSSSLNSETMLSPNNWPPGVLIKPFKFFQRPG